MINWLKSLGWVVIAGSILTAVLMVLSGAKIGRLNRRAENAERKADNLVQDHTKVHIDQAMKLRATAAKHKKKAAKAKDNIRTHLEKLGEADETIDTIAHRFNSRRKRLHSNTS